MTEPPSPGPDASPSVEPAATAIDLGTTRTRVAHGSHPEEAWIAVPGMPSRCARLEGHLVAGPGTAALDAAVDVKPLLGVRTHVPLDGIAESVAALTAEVLQVALASIESPSGPVVLTHPVDWLPERRVALRDSARLAGVDHPVLVADAMAAAWISAVDLDPGQHVSVHDLGAQTFQTSVLRRTSDGFVMAAHPTSGGGVSGQRLDQRLVDHVLAQVALDDPEVARNLAVPPDLRWALAASTLHRSARRAKEALSEQPLTTVDVPELADVSIERAQFDDLIAADLALARDVMIRAVQRGEQASGSRVVRHIVLGGCSLIPALAAAIDDEFAGQAEVVRPDPFLTVVRGALHSSARATARPLPLAVTPGPSGAGRPRAAAAVAVVAPVAVHRPRATRRPGRARRLAVAGALLAVGAAGIGVLVWDVVGDDGTSRAKTLEEAAGVPIGADGEPTTSTDADTLPSTSEAVRATPTTATSVPETTVATTDPTASTVTDPDTAVYWLVTRRGGVLAFGMDASPDTVELSSPTPVVGAAAADEGLWLLHADGAVTGYGVDPLGAVAPGTTAPYVAIVATASGRGYWTVAADGTVDAHGDAPALQTAPPAALRSPVSAIAVTPSGQGYWLAATDGAVFSYGDAKFIDAADDLELVAPVVGIAATPTGGGYWLVAEDGGVFAYGDVPFVDAASDLPLNRPVVAISATPTGQGYWLAASDGGLFAYGDATFESAFPEIDGVVALVPARR